MFYPLVRKGLPSLLLLMAIITLFWFARADIRAENNPPGIAIKTGKTVFIMDDEGGITLGTRFGMHIRIKPDSEELWLVDSALDGYILISRENKHITVTMGSSGIEIKNEGINIWSQGDIVISSQNGNVKINGKKVLLNE